MADEEDLNLNVSGNQVPAQFDPLDNTVEIPHPKRFAFILPNGGATQQGTGGCLLDRIEECTLTTIRHPRHGAPQIVLAAPDNLSRDGCVLFEVQEHHRKFGQTWLIDDHVEPRSPLYVATPLDTVFIAIYILRGCVTNSVESDAACGTDVNRQYLDGYSLLGKCPYIAILPPSCQARIAQSFSVVADVADADGNPVCLDALALDTEKTRRGVGEDENKGASVLTAMYAKYYYRFNEDKCVEWLRKKYNALLKAMQTAETTRTMRETEAASPNKACSSSSSVDISLGFPAQLLPEKACQVLAEYLDRVNEPLLTKATNGLVDLCQLRLDAVNIRKVNNTAAAASRIAMGESAVGTDDFGGEPAEKKKRVEIKSASVKKLEKAGAPKGTPTLFAMFGKKIAAAPSSSASIPTPAPPQQ